MLDEAAYWASRVGRFLATTLVMLIALAVSMLTVAGAFIYGTKLSGSPWVGAGFAALDAFKVIAPALAIAAWANGHWSRSIALWLVFVGLAPVSILGLASIYAETRGGQLVAREKAERHVAALVVQAEQGRQAVDAADRAIADTKVRPVPLTKRISRPVAEWLPSAHLGIARRR